MFKKKPCKLSRPNKCDLTRYEAFAHAYLAVGRKSYFNAELSAIEAGYGEGYARGNAYKLVGRSGIQEAMRRLRAERAKRSTIASPEEVHETLTLQLRVLPNQLADEDGAWIPIHMLTNEQAAAVAAIKETRRMITSGDDVIEERRLEYKLVDRQKAAEILARHHGLFERDNEQQKLDMPIRLVAMPVGDMTLEEWTAQAAAILDKSKHAPAPAQEV
jgi:phage terminase small subunit